MLIAGPSRQIPAIGCLMIGAAALLGLQPVFAESLWWHVARGREALTFNLLPSASLLNADVAAEADWLSGVPTALAFDLGGLHGLMLLQLLIAVSIAVMLIRAVDDEHAGLKAWLVLPALLLLCNRSLPVPASLTLLAIPLVWNIARDLQRESTSARLVQLFVVCAIAANLAPGVLWFLSTVAVAGVLRDNSPTARFSTPMFFRSLGAAAAAGCLTPRGVLAYRDAFVLAFPQVNVSRAYLTGTHFDVLASSDDRFAIALFAVLALFVAIHLFRRRSHVGVWACFGVLQVCAWSCAGNLLPVTVLLVLLGTADRASSTKTSTQWLHSSEPRGDYCGSSLQEYAAASGSPLTYFGTLWCHWTSVSKLSIRLRRFQPSAFMLATGLLTGTCVLGVADQDRRLGWGVAPLLDYRPLQRDLTGLEVEGTVLANDVLGVGVVALLELPNLTAHDTPERALLGDRWISSWHLWDDISHQRRNPYDRDDGTTGGWWSSLQNDDIKILLIDSRQHSILRALETTSWRMLSLDSPVIPYGFSGEPAMAKPILECWDARWMVNYGPWQYDFPGAAVVWGRTDIAGTVGCESLTDECRRLAGVFEALELYHASSKVLTAALSDQPSATVQNQLQKSMQRLARSEQTLASRASRWDTWLAVNPGDEKAAASRSLMLKLGFLPKRVLGASQLHFEPLAPSDNWQTARSYYFDGRLDLAMKALDSNNFATVFARAQLQIVLGQTDAATDTLKSLNDSEIDPVLSVLVAHELKSVQRN